MPVIFILSLVRTDAISQEPQLADPPGSVIQLTQAARRSFDEGDSENRRKHLTSLLDLYRRHRGSDEYEWCQRLAEVARGYLRAAELQSALPILGEAADLNLPSDDEKDDGLGSAAAGLHRRLAALDAEERFELLRDWSMPTETRRAVRVLMSMTPTDAPPTVFARSLGERPRNTSFPVAEVGGVPGLFCSTWEMVKAADDVGSLRRLTAELTRLADDDVPNARFALLLAKVVAARRTDGQLLDELTAYAEAISDRSTGIGLVLLPLTQRAWRFGSGRLDEAAERITDFQDFPYWHKTRLAWCGGPAYPQTSTGWCLVNRAGGIPGTERAAIRRWVAPSSGTISVAGRLTRKNTNGNGVRALVVSNRVGLSGTWTIQSGSISTSVEAVQVEPGDTIDFVVDCIDRNASFDHFSWTVRLDLLTNDGEKFTFDSATGFHGPTESHADLVIASASLTKEWLRPLGERIAKTKLEQTYGRESLRRRPFLLRALATAIRARYEEATSDLAAKSDLELWVPASAQESRRSAQGTVAPVWLAHENHILHWTGPQNDYLFFKYPLTGDFEFSCETQIGGDQGTDGCIAYGGLGYEIESARQVLRAWDASLNKLVELHCPFVANDPLATFNRFSLKSTGEGAIFSANRHPTWTDPSKGQSSPWIGLRSFGDRVPIFRNLKIIGNPIIPREVKMSEGNSLRGWATCFYGESTPQPAATESGLNVFLKRMTTSYDWSARSGIIYGAKHGSSNETKQSRLYYIRPLQDGESISYEFQYEPDHLEVHPALGRLAFLIEPSGVRLHWMTSGDQEWTGLAEDNTVVEPLNRRGPKPLPLRAGEWNRVTLAMKRETLTLSLNDATIYTRKIEPENDRTFGFYHDKKRSAVRVRNVVMRGDWPQRLTEEQLANLASVSDADQSESDRRVLGAIFDDRHVHGSVLAVRRQVAELDPAKQYDFLSRWVLPSPDHASWRLALDFTETNPAPPVTSAGGDLVSPALDLVEVAKGLDKLDELRERVAAVATVDDRQHRSQLAMLAAIDIAAGDLARAKTTLGKLSSLVAESKAFSFSERSPETLAIWSATPIAETREAVRDMAFHILTNQIQKNHPSGYQAWDQQMRSLASRIGYLDRVHRDRDERALEIRRVREGEASTASSLANASGYRGQSPLVNWVPASRETTRTRGKGFPRSRWESPAPDTIEAVASHDEDYLFYRLPLRGNFEVECDVNGFGFRETNLWVAGRWVGPVYTLRHVDVGDFRGRRRLPLDPPIFRPNVWMRYRAVVRDGVCTTYANGREIHQRELQAVHDPWLAVHSFYSTNGGVRNLRITGDPEIPAEVRLAANADLPGWLPINDGHRVGANGKWRYFPGGGIRGIRWDDLPGSNRETLLRYHRPMVEDGTIECEFYYREGETHVHPALDRLAFMLQPDGVRVHWVTNGKFDRAGLAPDNLFDEPHNRRGGEVLPLKEDTWNRLELSVIGDTVRLKLNDELVFERELEPTNQRTFGLFHYADRSEVLVRNIVWRGDWPRELPPPAEQELAGEGTESLDESAKGLAAVFHHEFTQDELPMERFRLGEGNLDHFDARLDGLHVARPGGAGYNESAIAPRIVIYGDFDIVASFEKFDPNPSPGGSSGVYLRAFMDSAKSNECMIFRRRLWHRAAPQPVLMASYVTQEAGGARRDRSSAETTEATSGRMRLARRGETVYYLFADGDSPNYRLLATRTATTEDVHSLHLMAQAQGEGQTKVVWKTLSIRAERLTGAAFSGVDEVLADLDQQRDTLRHHFIHDFAKDPFTQDGFHQWRQEPQQDAKGLRMLSTGTDNWTSSGIAPQLGLEGDFDVAVTFDEHDLGSPKKDLSSTFYLQVEFPGKEDQERMQVSVILQEYPAGEQHVQQQVAVVDAEGNKQYRRIRRNPVDMLESMRLARRGERVSFLYRTKGSDRDQILAAMKVGDSPVPKTCIRLMLHTGGAGRQSQVLLKQLRIDAEKISKDSANADESGGLLKPIRDLVDSSR